MKWTHCKTIWSIFTGRMSSVIKRNAGRGRWVHWEVEVPRRGWRKSLIRKMLEMMTTIERSHCTTSRVESGRSECQICLWLQVMTRDSCPILEGRSSSVKRVPVISQWLANVASINSKTCLRSWNNKSFFSLGKDKCWVRETSTAAFPKPLPLHTSAPHKVFLLPSCTFNLSVSYISSENLNGISWSVYERDFLFSNVLIAAM